MIQKTTTKIPIAKNVGIRKMAVPRPAKGMLAKIAPNLLDLVADLVERTTTQTRTRITTMIAEDENLHVVPLAVSVFFRAWTAYPSGGLAPSIKKKTTTYAFYGLSL